MQIMPPVQMKKKKNAGEVHKAMVVAPKPPWKKEGGYSYTAKIEGSSPFDTNANPKRSQLMLCEDGKPLGPGHAVHDEIRTVGSGHYSHWNGILYMSTSDNSDPNLNRRTYTVIDMELARYRDELGK